MSARYEFGSFVVCRCPDGRIGISEYRVTVCDEGSIFAVRHGPGTSCGEDGGPEQVWFRGVGTALAIPAPLRCGSACCCGGDLCDECPDEGHPCQKCESGCTGCRAGTGVRDHEDCAACRDCEPCNTPCPICEKCPICFHNCASADEGF
jgi:hypothetical protein